MVICYVGMWSLSRKVQPFLYNKNGLHAINLTWQPRRVAWNVHVWTMMTSLYQSVEAVGTIKWACVLCGHHIQNEQVGQQICIKFCIKLELPCEEILGWFRKPQPWAAGDWQLHHKTCPLMHQVSCRVFWQTSSHLGDSASLQPRFGALWLLAFPKAQITFEREKISDCRWNWGKYNRATDGDWENCVRSQGAYYEEDWSVIFLCTVFLVSCIFFNKCLYFSYYMSGYLLDRSCGKLIQYWLLFILRN